MMITAALLLVTSVTVSHSDYSLGLCRHHLVSGVYSKSVTLDDLVLDGDYTVLYTSGLKQLKNVACARLGYVHDNSSQQYEYYSYTETSENSELTVYPVAEVRPGKLKITLKNSAHSRQYIVYRGNGVLLTYWCKKRSDDNYDNNIWIIAAKTNVVNMDVTKKAILEMLYHDDYRTLIDNDIEESREENTKYTKLSPCKNRV